MHPRTEEQRRYRASRPEIVREQKKRSWARIKSDPKRLANKNKRGNAWYYRNRKEVLKKQHDSMWYQKNPLRHRGHHLKYRFGITLADYDKLLSKQNGVCAICRQPQRTPAHGVRTSLGVDHCHKTGKIRGLLCRRCNQGLGMLSDSIDLLQKALNYLRGEA
jgi:hypothetical protein